MKVALISDIHGNIEALDAVLADIDSRAPGAKIICAGDIVGYGPSPGECIQRLISRQILCILGNHDEMAIGRRNFSRCVYAGIVSSRWSRKNLSAMHLRFLNELPGHLEVTPEILVCHGTLNDSDLYISDEESAVSALAELEEGFSTATVLVCGHTHHAATYSNVTGFQFADPDNVFVVPKDGRCVLNPGSVGQSRDGTLMARYTILDTATQRVSFQGLSYDHAATIEKQRRAGLVVAVDLQRPVGVARYLEALRKRLARLWFRSNPELI